MAQGELGALGQNLAVMDQVSYFKPRRERERERVRALILSLPHGADTAQFLRKIKKNKTKTGALQDRMI